MNILFNMIDFQKQFDAFEESIVNSGFNVPTHVLTQGVCIFLGFNDISSLKKSIPAFKKTDHLHKIINKLKNTFTTSLSSHSKKRENIVFEFEGKVVLKKDILKNYTYQQFKQGIKNSSVFFEKNNCPISHASLLKAFSIFLGYTNWNTLSPVIKMKKTGLFNIYCEDHETIIEGVFLSLEEGVKHVYFVDLDIGHIFSNYLKQVNTLKHKYKVPLKEILKVKFIKKENINKELFNGDSLAFITDDIETNAYIFNNFVKKNKNYELIQDIH